MIDILIRAYNESIWLPQLFRSLINQKGNKIRNILLLDNNSNDKPENIVNQFAELNIIYKKYEREYLPGEMLNYGFRFLKELVKGKDISSDYLCTLSAHCFFHTNDSLSTLHDYIESVPKCRAGYGRQVPMTISDAQAIRDLVLLYPKENRLISKSPSFNNAYSLIKYEALLDHSFDNETTNLEDVIWANDELQKNFKIAYCGESEVVHYHGPHHSNSTVRLEQTKNIIKKNSKIFNIKLRKANIIDSDIISVFAGSKLNNILLSEIKNQVKNKKVIIWTNFDHKKDFSEIDLQNIIWIKREEKINTKRPIYSDLPELYEKLNNKNIYYNFYVLYDNSIDIKFQLIRPDSSKKVISENFGNVIWPSINSNKIIFTVDKSGDPYSNQKFNEIDFLKEKQIEVLRGNGTIISQAALINPKLMFKNPRFEFID